MDDKWTANHINEFFASLTKEIDVHSHISDTKIGYTQEKIDAVKSYAENGKMQFNLKKCKEMLIDFRRQKTTIPHIKVEDTIIERVTSLKLLDYGLTII